MATTGARAPPELAVAASTVPEASDAEGSGCQWRPAGACRWRGSRPVPTRMQRSLPAASVRFPGRSVAGPLCRRRRRAPGGGWPSWTGMEVTLGLGSVRRRLLLGRIRVGSESVPSRSGIDSGTVWLVSAAGGDLLEIGHGED